MRRAAPFGILGVGVFLLTFAVLLRVYAVPRMELAPLEIDVANVVTGTGRYLDTQTGRLAGPGKITVTLRLIGDVTQGRANGVSVWNVSNRIDTPLTVREKDPRHAFAWTVERWVFDRRTNMPVHCCGEQPRFSGVAYLKFPFHLGKHSYQVWDSGAQRAVTARYEGTQTVAGHRLYRFAASVPPVQVSVREVPGALVGMPERTSVQAGQYYRNAREDWLVEPVTGSIVSASSRPFITLRAPGSARDAVTVLDARLASNAQSVAFALARLDPALRQLRAVTWYVPVGGAVLGAGLAVAAVVMLRRREDERETPGGQVVGLPLQSVPPRPVDAAVGLPAHHAARSSTGRPFAHANGGRHARRS